jgi:soluble cytochrome b562
MQFKNKLRLGFGMCAMAFGMGAHAAFFIPVTDYANLAQRLYEEVQQEAAAATHLAGLDSIMQMFQNGADKSMQALNNGAANAAARMDQTLADIQNMAQLEKSMPTRDACTTSITGTSISNLACGDPAVQNDYQNIIDTVSGSVVGLYAKAQKATSGITGLVTSASTSVTPTQTESQKNYAAYLKKQIETFDQIKAWEDAGKGDLASDPRQLLPMGNYNPQFSDEELKMAQTYVYVTYPPYVRFNPTDPTEPQEILSELRMKNAVNNVGSVMTRQIEMRTPPSEGQPSKLTALEAQTAMRFTDQGALSTDGQSWITRVTQDNSYTTSAINREGAIMKSIKVRQMIDRYESSLIREKLLATYVLNVADNPSKKM